VIDRKRQARQDLGWGLEEQGVGRVHLLEGRAPPCRCWPSFWSFGTRVSPVARSLGSPAAAAE
jgi:hypothetical protein